MIELKQQDLLVGVKAEQSLRDALRDALDSDSAEAEGLELAPVGRKTWIAGQRLGPVEDLASLSRAMGSVLRRLLSLGSAQRIRQESVRVWVAAPPVPVFRDPEPRPDPAAAAAPEASVACPVCNRSVHPYNVQHDAAGNTVGCYVCGGNPGGYRS